MLTAALLIAAGLFGAPALELEIAGGLAHTLEENYGKTDYPALVPAAQARAGLRLTDHLSIGGTFLAVLGGQSPKSLSANSAGQSGFKAVAGLVSLRLHTPGETGAWIEGGAGTGHLISLQSDRNFEHPPLSGRGAAAFRLAVGGRIREGRAIFGLEVAWLRWYGVERPCCDGTGNMAASGLSTDALLLLFSVGFAISP